MTTMTPDHPHWKSFIRKLAATADTHGCDGDGTRLDPAPGKVGPTAEVHAHARRLLHNIGGVDVASSLAFFKTRGGHCDCEVLMNVDRDEVEAAFEGDPNV
jgi:hypothetical protein